MKNLKSTGIKITQVTIEQMLKDEANAAYNPSVWKDRVEAYAKYEKCQFYICPADDVFTYDRFFCIL